MEHELPHLVLRHGKDVRELAGFPVRELDAHGVDQHQLLEPGAAFGGQFQGQPATHGKPHHGQVVETEIVDQVQVQIGQIINTADSPVMRRAVKPGVGRQDDLEMRGQRIQIGRSRRWPGPAMQHQQWRTASELTARQFDTTHAQHAACDRQITHSPSSVRACPGVAWTTLSAALRRRA
nr:B530 [uncultured bacterium]